MENVSIRVPVLAPTCSAVGKFADDLVMFQNLPPDQVKFKPIHLTFQKF